MNRNNETTETFSKLWVTAMITLTMMLPVNVACSQTKQQVPQQSIKTIYPTKDWAISDFVVTAPEFGAKAEPGFDNRAAFQAAIDAAYQSGGGVVYIPAGNYEFRSTQVGTKNVRVRQGRSETKKDFHFEYVLRLHPGVQLRGDWADPVSHNGKVLGTILEVRVGKDSPNYDGSVESWWNDGQADNALRTTYTSIADRFIEMNAGTGVTNLSIWYPEQDIHHVKPYPWTLFQTQGDCATIERVTLVNSYNGFNSAPSELHYVLNSYMTALNKGIEVHVCTDIGRIENVRISPEYWANSGLPGAPSLEDVTAYTRANGTGYQMHRSDWEYVSYLYISGYKTGVWIGREPGFADAPNAQLYEVHVGDCGNGLYVEDVNPYGILISNSSFGAGQDGNAVYFYKDFSTSVQFNGVDFKGSVVGDGDGGVVSFESCTFSEYNDYALRMNRGNVLLSQCEFKKNAGHVYLGANMHTLKSVNSGYKSKLKVDNHSTSAKVEVITGKKYFFEPIPKNVKTNIDVHPRPVSDRVLKADLARATGFNNDRPVKDGRLIVQKSTLTDYPVFSWRAFMLDEGRYFKGKEVVFDLLDEMAALKMNVFHWHLTDDQGWRIEIKKYPKLTEIGAWRDSSEIDHFGSNRYDGRRHGGFYTQEEIKEVVDYAAKRNITVIPEIEMPGHASAAIAAYPWLGTSGKQIKVPGKFGVQYDIFNVADPRVIHFLNDVMDEVISLFPAPIFHVGGDEVRYDQWKESTLVREYMRKNDLRTPAELQVFFTNNVSNILASKGRRMMGWNEITGDKLHEFQSETDTKGKQKLAPGTIVHCWKGDPKLIKEAIEKGYDVVNSYHSYTYLDYTY